MAARENQGYLIAVIILVLLSLVLALAAFLGLSKMNEYADNKAAAEKSLVLEQKLNQSNGIRSEILKAFIGEMGGTVAEVQTQIDSLERLATSGTLEANEKAQVQAILDDVKNVKAIYDKDMLANSATTEADQAQEFTYKSLIKNLSMVLARKHGDYNVKDRQAQLAEQEATTKIAEKQAEVDQMKSTVSTLEDDLRKEKQLSADKQRELTASLEKSLEELQAASAKYDSLKLDTQGKIDQQQNQIAKFDRENSILKNKINVYEKETFDRPDGKIVKVAAALQTVFLDLGLTDGLTENRSFAIYDQSVTNFEKDKHKATIEVIRVMDNQSEARVTSEDPNNPIISGDYVLTATWDPGYAVPMALAGIFDLDKDGFEDLEKLKQLIKRNGGEVVAWHDDDGNIQGEINASVRYLVVGDSPELGPDANLNVVRAIAKMKSEAEANTVQVIDLQKLLNRMGVRGKPKIESLNRRPILGGTDFQERSPNDSLKSDNR